MLGATIYGWLCEVVLYVQLRLVLIVYGRYECLCLAATSGALCAGAVGTNVP